MKPHVRPSPSAHSVSNAGSSFLSEHETLVLWFKWIVYGLLFINFGLYLSKDITAAQHTITAQTTVMGWLAAFAPSMDQFAWVMLIFIYEFETYWLEDDFDNRLVLTFMTIGKVVFAVMILNTVVAYTSLLLEVYKVTPAGAAGELCQFADQGLSFLRNVAYTTITSENCTAISHAGELFRYPKDPVLTDTAGLNEDWWFRFLDLLEAGAWFLILGLTELSVRLLDRGIYKGALTNAEKLLKGLCYSILVGVSAFWVAKTQYMYVWDEFLWIASFLLLEINMSAWRAELASSDKGDPISNTQPTSA